MIKNTIFISLQILSILLIFAGTSIAGWGQTEAFYPGGHMMGGGYMGWMMIFFWVILISLLVLVIRWILQTGKSKDASRGQAETALERLKMRLANGEIDIEEFKEKSKYL